MNEYTKNELISYRLTRADETLNEVAKLIQLGYYNTSINRLYYATFYAAIALLLQEGIDVKSHAGVRKMLGLNFVSTGKITKKSGFIYSELFDKRHKGDYNDFFDFTEDDVVGLLQPAKELLKEIKSLIVL